MTGYKITKIERRTTNSDVAWSAVQQVCICFGKFLSVALAAWCAAQLLALPVLAVVGLFV